jgi:hypothetical protein
MQQRLQTPEFYLTYLYLNFPEFSLITTTATYNNAIILFIYFLLFLN